MHFNFRSLILVLIALTGNAKFLGFDLVVFMLLLATLFSYYLHFSLSLKKNSHILLAFLMTTLCFMGLRALQVDVPYLDLYWLWVIKAAYLFLLLCLGGQLSWPSGNMIFILLMCLSLIMVGSFKDGRLYSIFGPNMLYRFFGVVLFVSAMSVYYDKGIKRALSVLIAVFGSFAIMLTGSGGGVLIFVSILLVFFFKASPIICGIFTAAFIGCVATFLFSNGTSLPLRWIDADWMPLALTRLLYKLDTLSSVDRFVVWVDLLSQPISILGKNYENFNGTWIDGHIYPHNIFIELIVFYGVLGHLAGLIVIIAIIKSLSYLLSRDISAITFVIIFIGAQLSGDLSDNYAVISFAFYFLLRQKYEFNNQANMQG